MEDEIGKLHDFAVFILAVLATPRLCGGVGDVHFIALRRGLQKKKYLYRLGIFCFVTDIALCY